MHKNIILSSSPVVVHHSHLHLHTQMKRERSALLPVSETTKDLLENITDIFLMLEEIKKVSRHILPP